MTRAIAIVGLFAAVAHAQPADERLTQEQIAAAGALARAKLKPVDKAAAKVCSTKYAAALDAASPQAAGDRLHAAECFHAARSLGTAIRLWQLVSDGDTTARERLTALRALGTAYETAGTFSSAAEQHRRYATLFPAEADARERLIRAYCIWRQLGVEQSARDVWSDYQRLYGSRAPKLDPHDACAAVRPIPTSR